MGNYEDHSGYTQMAREIFEQSPKTKGITASKLSRLAKAVTVGELVEIRKRIDRLQSEKCDSRSVAEMLDCKLQVLGQKAGTLVIEKTEAKDPKLEYAKMDYDLVHREILDIKTCRTNMFMGTLGVIGAVGVGILGIAGLRGENMAPFYAWLPLASAIPIGLLTSAILATIHKARGINERTGYMKAVSEILIGKEPCSSFCGWPTAKLVTEQCQLYLSMEHPKVHDCGLKSEVKQETEKKREPFCVTKARADSSLLNNEVELVPPFLHSFTSFSTYVYSAAYFIAVLALLFAFVVVIQNCTEDFSQFAYWLFVLLGFTATSALGLIAMRYKVRSDREHKFRAEREKITKMESVLKIYGYIAGALFPIFLAGLLWQDGDLFGLQIILKLICVYGLGFVIATLGIFIAYACYDKVYSLRKGRYSVERWYYLWKACFQNCPLMGVVRDPPRNHLDE